MPRPDEALSSAIELLEPPSPPAAANPPEPNHDRDEVPDILTVPAAASFLKIGRAKLYELVRRRKIGGWVKIGKHIRFTRRGLLDWLESCQAPGPRPRARGRPHSSGSG